MKLYISNNISNQKIYLNMLASTREELAYLIGSPWFFMNGEQYHVHNVVAESESNNTVAGAIVGGLIGLVTGSAGILIGAAIGGALGSGGDKSEAEKVKYFNNSRFYV